MDKKIKNLEEEKGTPKDPEKAILFSLSLEYAEKLKMEKEMWEMSRR